MKYSLTDLLDKRHRGWLVLRVDGVNKEFCYGTTVESLEEFDIKYPYKFKVIDGPYRGGVVEIPYKKKTKTSSISYLSADEKGNDEIVIRFDSSKGVLSFREWKVSIIQERKYQLKTGRYRLLIPRYSHGRSEKYLDESKRGSRFAGTWFPIESLDGVFDNRFLHFGTISEGCLTVTGDGRLWSRLYLLLMNNRIDLRCVSFLDIF